MSKVKVVPCSGIGKVFGLLSREAGLEATERLAPELCETACLAHILTTDEEARDKVAGQACIAVDGCALMCAAKSIEAAGGVVAGQFRAVDVMKTHRGENAGTGTALTEAGWKMAGELAQQVVEKAREIAEEGE